MAEAYFDFWRRLAMNWQDVASYTAVLVAISTLVKLVWDSSKVTKAIKDSEDQIRGQDRKHMSDLAKEHDVINSELGKANEVIRSAVASVAEDVTAIKTRQQDQIAREQHALQQMTNPQQDFNNHLTAMASYSHLLLQNATEIAELKDVIRSLEKKLSDQLGYQDHLERENAKLQVKVDTMEKEIDTLKRGNDDPGGILPRIM